MPQGLGAPQDHQGGQRKERIQCPNCAAHQAEQRSKQTEVPVHRLEHVVQKKRVGNVEDRSDIADERQSKQRLARQDVVRRRRRVAVDNESTANDSSET